MDRTTVHLKTSEDGKRYYSSGFSILKEGIVKAIGLLLKALIKCINTKAQHWTARVQVVVEVQNGAIINKYANLTISPDGVFETDTTVIDREDLDISNSSTFDAMIRKTT